jgi:peptidoglycan/LPS O-acetylase OafA/YrhL
VAWLVGHPATEAELHRNSFDLLRLAFALLVIVSHAYSLSGHGASEPLAIWSHFQLSWGDFSLAGFFVVSGYLITRSYVQVSSLPRFLWHRALRILPGYWVRLLVTVFVAGPLLAAFAGLPLGRYWSASHDGPLAYLRANWLIALVQLKISGLPDARAPASLAVDGSLWSLRLEVFCYFGVGLLGVLGVLLSGRARPLVPLVAGYCMLLGMEFSTWSLALWACFYVGASAYLYRRLLLLSPLLALVAFVGCMLLLHTNAFVIGVVLLQSYALLTIGFRVGVRPAQWLRRHIGDLSYGTYIYAFVIAQVLAEAGLARTLSLLLYVLLTATLTLPLAYGSWRLIEAPALRLKARGRAAQPAPH